MLSVLLLDYDRYGKNLYISWPLLGRRPALPVTTTTHSAGRRANKGQPGFCHTSHNLIIKDIMTQKTVINTDIVKKL